jgi:aerobic-type carbon monoxide dehydrogenase small subunit (CoxS/CutS family)
VLSCLTLAVMHDGSEVTTVEGLAQGDRLHPLQEAFMQHDAFQCGYCTPGHCAPRSDWRTRAMRRRSTTCAS